MSDPSIGANGPSASTARKPFVRPVTRTGPRRSAANFYRSASGSGVVIGGVPMDTVEDAVTAAVRMGYQIAQAQIDRTTRIAHRFRDAGERAAGPHSERQALDATEQIVFKALMAGIGWLEGLATDQQNPLKRLATAEFNLLGSLLGLTPLRDSSQDDADGSRRSRRTPRSDRTEAAGVRDGAAAGAARSRPTPRGHAPLRVKQEGTERRVVQVRAWELDADVTRGDYEAVFYSAQAGPLRIAGSLTIRPPEPALLSLTIPPEAVAGTWKAAICDKHGVQLGFAEFSI